MDKPEVKSLDCFAASAEAEKDSKFLSLLNSSILRDLLMANLPVSEEGKCSMNCSFTSHECV